MNNYWKRAGNPRWGFRMLANDIKRNINHRKHKQFVPNIKIKEGQSQQSTEDVCPSPPSFFDKAPTYVYNNYNYQMKSYGYLGFWKTIFLILFMVFVVILVYYICFNPKQLVEWAQRIIDWFQSF